MSTFLFLAISIITIIVSELSHPPIEMWVPVSCIAWLLILVSVVFAICVRKNRAISLKAGLFAFFIFWEYAIISVVSFLRMVDDFMSKPLEEKSMFGVGAVLFLIIAYFSTKKLTETE